MIASVFLVSMDCHFLDEGTAFFTCTASIWLMVYDVVR